MALDFTDMQKDAIAEVMNISMGNAATAASELLSAKVWITTPKVTVKKASELHDKRFEPAVCVKIVYIKGISGTNLMVLKQDDVQMILNQLMGQPLEVTPDFEFDELNISAVSEVMNQMMGSSATALSNFLGVHIDISTPTPYIMEEIDLADIQDYEPDDYVVAINFDITIEGVIKSEFVSVMSIDLAQAISAKVLNMNDEEEETPPPKAAQSAAPTSAQNIPQQSVSQGVSQVAPPPQNFGGQQGQPAQPYGQQAMYPPPGGVPYGGQQSPQGGQIPQGYMQQGYAPMPGMGYGYGNYPAYPQNPYQQTPINIQNATLHPFESWQNLPTDQQDNLKLLMGVPLQISVEIGTARKKVKDILEFTQGTIIELERQAGAPVDVVVNGNLIAKGDVVVIDDNFAVRITEILKSKFMDSLGKE